MVTVDDVLAINPCDPYTDRSVVEVLFAGRESCGFDDFIAMDIPAFCKISVVIRTGLVPEEVQTILKPQYVSRINKMAAPRLWREANNGSCEEAAHAGQMYAIQKAHAASSIQRKEVADIEAEWQLARLLEAM